jgi:hypothetical protein
LLINNYLNLQIIFLFVLFFIFSLKLTAQDEFTLQEGTVVVPVDGGRAKELLATEDEYTAILSRFDLMSKSLSKSDTVKLQDYFKKAEESVKIWSEDDKKGLKKVVGSISKKIKALGLKIKMPARIEVVKSDMTNEGGATGYTRSNYIVMKDNSVEGSSGSYEDIFIHELFHVLSRYDKTMSEKVYNIIGFKKCNEVPYPTEIAGLRLSNPDAPFNNYYITVKFNDKPIDVMLILFSGREFTGGSFFGYMQIGLLAVEGDEQNKKVIYNDGKPLILKFKDVKGFYEQTGRNTDYNIHAEELSADHFIMLLNQESGLPNPEIIEAMKQVMKNP